MTFQLDPHWSKAAPTLNWGIVRLDHNVNKRHGDI